MLDDISCTRASVELLTDTSELEKALQEGINGVLNQLIDGLDVIGMLHLNVMKRDLGSGMRAESDAKVAAYSTAILEMIFFFSTTVMLSGKVT
jgi:hypothetical protein